MLIAILCLCSFGYLFWSKILKAPEDSPPKLSYIGCMKICLYNSDLWSSLMYICDSTRKMGGVAYGNLGFHAMYTISDPEHCLTVLKSCSEKGFFYDFWKPWLGDGLFTGRVHINKQHRKYFLPMVSPRKLDSFIKDFNENANRFVSKMAPRVGKQPIDILRDLLVFNVELFCATLLGLPDIHENYDFNLYCETVEKFMKIVSDRFETLPYHIDAIYNYTKLKKEQDKAVETLHSTSTDLIQRRRVLYIKEKQERNDTKESAKDVYTDILLEAVDQGLLTETEMREEINTILFGGHDTTAFTLLYALVLIGSYPEVQEKIFQEVEGILDKNKDITKDDLSRMMYLESCIMESQRLYPYAVIQARRFVTDVKLSRKYAMLSMKTLLARLIREYRIKADHTKLQFEFVGVLESKSGHEITLERRA